MRSGAKLVPKTEQIDTLGALVSHIELNKSLTPHDMVEMELQKSKPFCVGCDRGVTGGGM